MPERDEGPGAAARSPAGPPEPSRMGNGQAIALALLKERRFTIMVAALVLLCFLASSFDLRRQVRERALLTDIREHTSRVETMETRRLLSEHRERLASNDAALLGTLRSIE